MLLLQHAAIAAVRSYGFRGRFSLCCHSGVERAALIGCCVVTNAPTVGAVGAEQLLLLGGGAVLAIVISGTFHAPFLGLKRTRCVLIQLAMETLPDGVRGSLLQALRS